REAGEPDLVLRLPEPPGPHDHTSVDEGKLVVLHQEDSQAVLEREGLRLGDLERGEGGIDDVGVALGLAGRGRGGHGEEEAGGEEAEGDPAAHRAPSVLAAACACSAFSIRPTVRFDATNVALATRMTSSLETLSSLPRYLKISRQSP